MKTGVLDTKECIFVLGQDHGGLTMCRMCPIPSSTTLGNELLRIGLLWIHWVVSRTELHCSGTYNKRNFLV